jgi:hypothetical protein
VLGILYLLLLGLERGLTSRGSTFWHWGVRGLLVALGGLIPVASVQIESHFADEEFFAALQCLALSLLFALLIAAQALLVKKEPRSARRGVQLDRRWLGLAVCALALIGLIATVHAYQRSFYPPQAPVYQGISEDNPFLCGKVPPDPETYDGVEVFQRMLAQIASNPHAGLPEYGMLALGTGEQQWAKAFREILLNEAAEGFFTDPAYSVKSAQHDAALRAYYFPRVHDAYPGLFSSQDLVLLREWFATINNRAHTVEPVDWMYALAFAKWPEGPYENQETGPGLLALLESEELAAPDLAPANQDYLERYQRGWITRFRNTDDAFIYQPEWITNAYFQSLYTGEVPDENVRLSLEWLLLQALPDGAPLSYNHPGHRSLGSIAYQGVQFLNDPALVWLAGRALEDAVREGEYLYAQPGAEQPVSTIGRSPTQGSCLLFGDSGLPNQAGPLAPDKIVFRDGWTEGAAYVLLNLRFTGWHRYKATNTVTLVYQDGILASDDMDGQPVGWLPVGRSAFRDKRIPRENLNGLLIPQSGMSAVLYHLSGVNGPWAQDPPFYAKVVAFETGEELDWSRTRLTDWRGWQHDRWLYFYHDGGPIVVVDDAVGPSGRQTALAWHVAGVPTSDGQRITLHGRKQPAEVLVLPLSTDGTRTEISEKHDGRAFSHVYVYAPPVGRLRMATLFLLEDWVGADATFHPETQTLHITHGQKHLAIPVSLKE